MRNPERRKNPPYEQFQEYRLRFIIHRVIDFLGGSMYEHDGKTPSSSRLIAVMIFTTLNALTAGVIVGLMHMIVVTGHAIPIALAAGKPADDLVKVVEHLSTAVVSITLWWFLFLAATALSLYGINVWKYVAAIRTGVMPNAQAPGAMMGQPAAYSLSRPSVIPSYPSNVPGLPTGQGTTTKIAAVTKPIVPPPPALDDDELGSKID